MANPHPRDTLIEAIAGFIPDSAPAAFAMATLAQLRASSLESMTPEAAAAALSETWEFVRCAKAMGPNLTIRAAASTDGSAAVLLSSMADQPFIIDTIRKALRTLGASQVEGFNVVLRIVRSGEQVRLGADGEGRAESALRFRFEGVASAQLPAVEADLRDRLGLACSVVSDFESMTGLIEATADAAVEVSGEDGVEAAEFLRWLLAENFVFLGITRASATASDTRLGADRSINTLWPAAEISAFPGIIQVRKGTAEAPVHRTGRVDVIRIALPGSQTVVRGLFTHRALTQPCRHLPLLRRTLAEVLAETRQRPNSYRYRGLANIFDSLPTEMLFSATAQQVRSVIEQIFDAEQDQQARAHVAQQDEGGTTFTLVSIPERRYSEELRNDVQALLARVTGANYTHSSLFAGRYDSVLLQVYQTGTRLLSAEDCHLLQQDVNALTTPASLRATAQIPQTFDEHALLIDLTGATAAEIADAWEQALKLTGGAQLRADLLAAAVSPEATRYAWSLYTDGLEALVAMWLNPGSAGPTAELPDDFASALLELAQSRSAQAHTHERVAQQVANGLSESLATRIVDASRALYASEICAVARARKESIADTARRYQSVGDLSGLLALTRIDGRGETGRGETGRGASRWYPVARHILGLRYTVLLRDVVLRHESSPESLPAGRLEAIAAILNRVVSESPDLAALLVAERRLRAVV